MMPFEAQEGC